MNSFMPYGDVLWAVNSSTNNNSRIIVWSHSRTDHSYSISTLSIYRESLFFRFCFFLMMTRDTCRKLEYTICDFCENQHDIRGSFILTLLIFKLLKWKKGAKKLVLLKNGAIFLYVKKCKFFIFFDYFFVDFASKQTLKIF